MQTAHRCVKLGLEFLILTATRSGEVRGADAYEFDLDAKFWTIPKDRTKTGKEHVVPLCDRAIEIFTRQGGSLLTASSCSRANPKEIGRFPT